MRIAIVNITSGGLSGGYRKYLHSVLPAIESDERVERIELFIPPGVEIDKPLAIRAHRLPTNAVGPSLRKLRALLHQMRPDVVFIPTARWLDCGDTPVVSMVRNMEPLLIPFSPRHPAEIARNLARRYAAFRSCTRSDGVIAVSSFVKDFLQTKWHVPSERLAVVHHGVTIPSDQPNSKAQGSIRILSGRRFLFTAGSIRPARGLEDAIKAVSAIVRDGIPISLAIAGSSDRRMHGYAVGLQRLAQELGCSENIVWLGSLDQSSMSWALTNCAAFIMTSRAEACPNIVLEAMAHGCVCVSTDTAPMPEMFGDTANYYRTGNVGSLSAALRIAMEMDSNAIAVMRARAHRRATQFSWDRTARATVDFLDSRVRQGPAGRRWQT